MGWQTSPSDTRPAVSIIRRFTPAVKIGIDREWGEDLGGRGQVHRVEATLVRDRSFVELPDSA